MIRELKPNNPGGIQRGLQQLKRYAEAFQKAFGKEPATKLDTY